MTEDHRLSRRNFIQRIGLLGAAGAVLAGCGGGDEADPEMGDGAVTDDDLSAATNAETCDDLTGLTEAEIQARRETFQYVDESPNPEQLCDNCQFWLPAENDGFCGGCTIVKGPIHPDGWCISWAPQTA